PSVAATCVNRVSGPDAGRSAMLMMLHPNSVRAVPRPTFGPLPGYHLLVPFTEGRGGWWGHRETLLGRARTRRALVSERRRARPVGQPNRPEPTRPRRLAQVLSGGRPVPPRPQGDPRRRPGSSRRPARHRARRLRGVRPDGPQWQAGPGTDPLPPR